MHQNLKLTNVYQRTVKVADDYRIICHEGGSRCFSGEQKVVTKTGGKKISDVKVGDYVLSGVNKEYKRVKNIFKMENDKPCFEITLKDGNKIRATQDHKFWYEGGWHSLKHMVKCWNERNMENNT